MTELRIDYSALTDLASSAGRRLRSSKRTSAVARISLGLIVLAVLPFALLIRGGILLYQWWGLGTWPSLLLAALATLWLLAVYAVAAGRWLGAGRELRRQFARGAMAVGAAYVVYGLVFVAGANVKSPEVRAEYRALHPLLRLGSSAIILLDSGSIITDAARSEPDYARMGLPAEERSMHYRQRDGYVHALDLRTNGRSGLRNFSIQVAFRALGFRVLRHVGTADHLHVSLPLPG